MDLNKTLLKENTVDLVINRSKVRRERSKTREALQDQESAAGRKVRALYFDGRKDDTLAKEVEKSGKMYKRLRKEEHISIMEEPGLVYLSHVSPKGNGAENAAEAIWEWVRLAAIDLSSLRVIGSDGEVKNTGSHTGIIRRLEENLRRPLQHAVCQLHTNELPLRHLVQNS